MSAGKIVYEAVGDNIFVKEILPYAVPLTRFGALDAAKKLNEHARLVEILKRVEGLTRNSAPLSKRSRAKLKALLAEVEKET